MDNYQIQVILQLGLAVFLGALIGLEREFKKKEAGLQTYSLVALGACLFTIVSFELFNAFYGRGGVAFDPSRIVLAVATGIGFIGAGAIIYRQPHVEGLTTAAGLWAAASIGVAIGAELYFISLVATFLIIVVLGLFGALERRFFKKD
jgi:putative Mg2+ transporter-C (MgtC) family protein